MAFDCQLKARPLSLPATPLFPDDHSRQFGMNQEKLRRAHRGLSQLSGGYHNLPVDLFCLIRFRRICGRRHQFFHFFTILSESL